jgi:hypothetical protein
MQAKLTKQTLGKILTKLVNANWSNWDVMLVNVLWAYRMAYKVTIQYTPFELVYGTQLIMLVEFVILIKRVRNLP